MFEKIDKWKRGLAIEILYLITAIAAGIALNMNVHFKKPPVKVDPGPMMACYINVCFS